MGGGDGAAARSAAGAGSAHDAEPVAAGSGWHGCDRVRVLHSLRPDHRRGSNPFVHQFVDSLPAHVESRFWTWRRALFGRYDVVHLQWFEYNLRSRHPAKRLALRLGGRLLCLRWSLTGQPVVTTVHNARPHEQGSAGEHRLVQRVDALTTHRIHLNGAAANGPGDSTILHGHYRVRVARLPAPDAVPGRILCFGTLRAYKNVTALAAAFTAIDDPAPAPPSTAVSSLHIVGACPDPAISAELTRLAGADPRITPALSAVPEDRLVHEVRAAQLVVLPYTDMMNSGALLLALSCGRPALVPATPANLALAAEVGAGWVRTFDGSLTAQHLVDALQVAARAGSWPDPDLSAREWPDAGQRYARVYRTLALRRTQRSRPEAPSRTSGDVTVPSSGPGAAERLSSPAATIPAAERSNR